MEQQVPCRWAKTKPVVVSGDRTGAGRLKSVAPLAGSSSDRQNACGAGSAGPVPEGPGETALGEAGTRHQTWLVHGWVSVGERFPMVRRGPYFVKELVDRSRVFSSCDTLPLAQARGCSGDARHTRPRYRLRGRPGPQHGLGRVRSAVQEPPAAGADRGT